MNNEELLKQLSNLNLAGLAEAAERLLPSILNIEDPEDAACRVAELAHLPSGAIIGIEALAQETGNSSLNELERILRIVLIDFAVSQPDGETAVATAAKETGLKLIVVGPELYGMCALFVAGYLAIRTGGKKSETHDKEVTISPDGTTKVKFHDRVEYLDPFGPLSKLLKRVTGGSESDAE